MLRRVYRPERGAEGLRDARRRRFQARVRIRLQLRVAEMSSAVADPCERTKRMSSIEARSRDGQMNVHVKVLTRLGAGSPTHAHVYTRRRRAK